jgi:hypothetical protein
LPILSCCHQQPRVVAVGPLDGHRQRDARPVGESMLRFVPILARSVGLLPLAPRPKGAFLIAPSMACHSHSMPSSSSYSSRAPPATTARRTPSAPIVGSGRGRWKRLPSAWAAHSTECPCVEHVDHRSESLAVVHWGPAALGVGGCGRDQGLNLLPKLVAHPPRFGARHVLGLISSVPLTVSLLGFIPYQLCRFSDKD